MKNMQSWAIKSFSYKNKKVYVDSVVIKRAALTTAQGTPGKCPGAHKRIEDPTVLVDFAIIKGLII